MPIYEFKCVECEKDIELLLDMDERDKPQECKDCGGKLNRLISLPRILGLDSKTGIKAWGVPPPYDPKKATERF